MKTATTVVKLCRVIEQFQDRQSFGITDLARRTELLPSDVHRILTSLRMFGYIEQDPETRKYRLGFSLLRIGLAALHRNQLCIKAHPVLTRLSGEIAATIRLAYLDRRELKVFLVDQVDGPSVLAFGDHLGGAERLHCTALGKTILANLSQEIALSALEKSGLTRLTRRTITERPVLERQFEDIRRLGYAVDREEYLNGLCCLASPLRDSDGKVVGAISTSMSSPEFAAWDEFGLGSRIKAAALRVSSTLESPELIPSDLTQHP
jgi:IclR family KDG regulon transcriptional repressor